MECPICFKDYGEFTLDHLISTSTIIVLGSCEECLRKKAGKGPKKGRKPHTGHPGADKQY